MFISDLSYLENVTEGLEDITGGSRRRRGGRRTNVSYRKDIYVDIRADVDIYATADIHGNTATGFGDALAVGDNSASDMELVLTANDYSSRSVAQGSAAVD